jgi:hypothetical protein
MAVEINLISIFLCARVLNRFPCFRLVSYFTGHTSTNYDKIHKISTLLTCKRAPPPFLCRRAPHISRYYVTLHVTGCGYHLSWVCKWWGKGLSHQLSMGSVRKMPRENTAGLSVRVTKLIFISQHKQQHHQSQTNGATELR